MIRNVLIVSLLSLLPILPAFSQSTLAEPTTLTYKTARNLIIQKVDFNDTLLSDVLASFQKESVAADPEKNGLNFILKNSDEAGSKEPLITLNLRKVPLSELLKYISSMTNYQVSFEEHAIVVSAPKTIPKP